MNCGIVAIILVVIIGIIALIAIYIKENSIWSWLPW
jgi:hypothetical protein